MSFRMSAISKRKLITQQSADKKYDYSLLYKDIALNTQKVKKNVEWQNTQLELLFQQDPDFLKCLVKQC